MKLNEINKELQTWFKIESYEDVEKLSLREFHKEFQVRKVNSKGWNSLMEMTKFLKDFSW